MSARTRASSAAAGGGDSFLVVAALDTPAKLKSRADYVCDGTNVTGGDEVEINTALGVSNVVILCPGTFWTSQPIVMASNKGLIGGGAGCIIKFRDAINAARNMIANSDPTNGNDHITIKNLKLDGNKANNTVSAQRGIYFVKVGSGTGATAKAGCLIEGCFIENFRREGIYLNNSYNSTILANTAEANNWDGIVLEYSSNNVVSGNNCPGQGYQGINLTYANNNTVTGNICQGNKDAGIWVSYSNNNAIAGNVAQGSDYEGIYLDHSYKNTISGNIAQGNGTHGILLSFSDNNTVSGNVVQGNLGTEGAIYVSQSKNITIVGNDCRENAYSGILMSYANNSTVVGNSCQGNQKAGIWIEDTDNCTVSDNTCTENSQEATNTYDDIWIITCNYMNIDGNTCRAGALANKPRSGICIGWNAGDICTKNKVTNNDLYDDGFGTGALRVLVGVNITTIIVGNRGYNPKGNVANPYPVAAGNLSDSAAAQAFPTTAVNYTVSESPKLITIYGGTITSVSIDGVATGQAGAASFAAYRLEPGQILNVVWTVQPSSVVYAT
jgi:parallel beta-helix repeat protein